MGERKIQDRFNELDEKLRNVEGLREGTGNDLLFYIFDYHPKDELLVRDEILRLRKLYSHVVEFDLYQMLNKVIDDEGYLELIHQREKEYPINILLDQMIGPLLGLGEDDNPIIKEFKDRVEDDGEHIVLITGVGKAYPIIRSHTILNTLHSVFKNNPVVMLYPGRYEKVKGNMILNLFEKLDDDNYYRAFPLVDRGGKKHAN